MEQLFSYLLHLGITTKNNTAAGSYLHNALYAICMYIVSTYISMMVTNGH